MNILTKIGTIVKTGIKETINKRTMIALSIPLIACGGFASWAVIKQRRQDEQYLLEHPDEEYPEKEHPKSVLREVWDLLDGEQLTARLVWAILFAIAVSGVREEIILPYLRKRNNRNKTNYKRDRFIKFYYNNKC